jgi:hypothetical protein
MGSRGCKKSKDFQQKKIMDAARIEPVTSR